jgi:hypothetical protein
MVGCKLAGCLPSEGSEEQAMRANLDHNGETPQDQEDPNLSRRSFLARLTILGVGCAAAMTLSVGKADATTQIDTATKAKDLADDEALAEAKKAEAVDDVDQDDELEFSAQTRGMTRRRVRRTRRRVRRRYRRTRRRARRATRRVRRRVRRGVELIVNWAVGAS